MWTAEDANTILNNSPWAKQIKITPPQSGTRRGGGMGRRGGMGYPGGGYPGGGYPGGGQRRGSGGGGGAMPVEGTIRWESARPVQQAEARLKNLNPPADAQAAETRAGEKPAAAPADHYVISLLGVSARNGGGENNTQAFDQFMSGTQLVMKNKTPISPDDVKFLNENGQSEIRFFFPKTNPIAPGDKEVTFHTMVSRTKLEHKFDLKKMTRNGKLELD